jgi:hypothetical protein
MDELPSDRELTNLPLRAIVAFAARCARRVQPRFEAWVRSNGANGATNPHWLAQVETATKLAEDYAAGVERISADYETPIEAVHHAARKVGEKGASETALQASHAAHSAAYALRTARAAARYANPSPHETFPAPDTVAIMAAHAAAAALHAGGGVDAARRDFGVLACGDYGRFPDLGQPVVVDESGPLGEL